MCFYIIFWLYIRPLYNIILVECGIHNKNSIMIIFPFSKFVPRRFCSARVFASRFPEISWSIGWFLMPNQTFWVRISRLEIWHNKFLNYICQTYIEVIVWSHVKIIKIFRFSCTKQSKFISIFTLFSVRETCIYPPYFSYIPSLFSYLFLSQPLKFLSTPSSVFAVNFQRAIIFSCNHAEALEYLADTLNASCARWDLRHGSGKNWRTISILRYFHILQHGQVSPFRRYTILSAW